MWVEVAKKDELLDGATKVVKVGAEEILLARVDGKIYATQALCSHMNMYLHAGKLEGNTITCPFHGARFDVATGKVLSPHNPQIDQYLEQMKLPKVPTRPLNTYEVKVVGDDVSVKI